VAETCYAGTAIGVACMPDYRIYCLDGAGKISFAEELIASSDDEAITKAHRLKQKALKCEVWQGRRLVATLSTQGLAE
jgi:hypothetical protein